MVARVIGYVLLLVGAVGAALDDPDIHYPGVILATVGAVAVIEGAISQIVGTIRRA